MAKIGRIKGCIAWNKGLTKDDPRVLKYTTPKIGRKRPDIAGENNWRWIEDRGQVVKRDYPELRYEVNNGITLCHFHHPRKINDEMKLSPYFQELIKVN